jgi:hypothetical protein
MKLIVGVNIIKSSLQLLESIFSLNLNLRARPEAFQSMASTGAPLKQTPKKKG